MSYDEIKWKLEDKHVERLDKVKFLENELHHKDSQIKELERRLKQKCPKSPPEHFDVSYHEDKQQDDLHKMAAKVRMLIKAGKGGEAEIMTKKLDILVRLKEAKKLIDQDPIKAQQKVFEAQNALADSHLPANEVRKLHFEIEEIKTEIKMHV